MPLKPSSMSLSRSAGSSCLVASHAREEVLQGEVEAGGHVVLADAVGVVGAQVRKVHGHGTVRVGADAVAVAVFAVIEVLVLVPQNRQRSPVGKFVASLLCWHRSGFDVLVGQGEKGDDHANHFADLGAPEACAGDHDVGGDDTFGGLDTGHATAGLLNARDRGVAQVLDACGFRALDQQLDGPGGTCQAVTGDVEPAQDVFLVQERVELLALSAGKDLAFDSPRGGVSELPLQIRQAGLGGGDFEATDLVEATDAVLGQGQELLNGVPGEGSHGL
ncbi:hypothetical protein QFZ79_003878 [Arthrobacter sp. V4I6]|nr:hypothetical protein [Arthrobacter sp. V4I6]